MTWCPPKWHRNKTIHFTLSYLRTGLHFPWPFKGLAIIVHLWATIALIAISLASWLVWSSLQHCEFHNQLVSLLGLDCNGTRKETQQDKFFIIPSRFWPLYNGFSLCVPSDKANQDEGLKSCCSAMWTTCGYHNTIVRYIQFRDTKTAWDTRIDCREAHKMLYKYRLGHRPVLFSSNGFMPSDSWNRRIVRMTKARGHPVKHNNKFAPSETHKRSENKETLELRHWLRMTALQQALWHSRSMT